MNNQERIRRSPEAQHDAEDIKRAGIEQREKLREQLERQGEQSHEKIDDIRQEALEKAKSVERERTAETDQPTPAERRTDKPIKAGDASFKATMSEVWSQMPAPSRVFSKVIHNKAVEKVSEVTGNTVARPNAILSGAVFAFTLTLAVFLVAKNLGYPLSGFETIGAFLLGWVLGLVYDFLKIMITGRK